MPLPDPADHTPDCSAVETGQVPDLVVTFSPSVNAGTVMVQYWERCPSCYATVAYERQRMPWRRFHRQWRSALAVWVATWEHRHDVGGRVTGS